MKKYIYTKRENFGNGKIVEQDSVEAENAKTAMSLCGFDRDDLCMETDGSAWLLIEEPRGEYLCAVDVVVQA